jgi:antitoxin FitA
MPSITIKNIPQDLYENLKQSAGANHRSVSGEIIACIERSVAHRDRDVEAILANARRLREKWKGPLITDEEFTAAKRSGRP